MSVDVERRRLAVLEEIYEQYLMALHVVYGVNPRLQQVVSRASCCSLPSPPADGAHEITAVLEDGTELVCRHVGGWLSYPVRFPPEFTDLDAEWESVTGDKPPGRGDPQYRNWDVTIFGSCGRTDCDESRRERSVGGIEWNGDPTGPPAVFSPARMPGCVLGRGSSEYGRDAPADLLAVVGAALNARRRGRGW